MFPEHVSEFAGGLLRNGVTAGGLAVILMQARNRGRGCGIVISVMADRGGVDRGLTARGARKLADVPEIGDGTVNVVLAMWSLHLNRSD